MLRRAFRGTVPRKGVRNASVYSKKISRDVNVAGATKSFFDLTEFGPQYRSLPLSIRVLLESAVRNCDNFLISENDVAQILAWDTQQGKSEIPFIPARVVLQDFTGVPAVVDLASMRDTTKRLGGEASAINPLVPVDLVIDHSVQVDFFGTPDALQKNHDLEFERNKERFRFLKWGSQAFDGLTIVPPGSGIVHQVNLEYLARVVFDQKNTLYPDSLVGTDSHTTMINGLGVLGWGVGGIEAEAAMLGQPIRMVLPEVVGFRLTGKLREGVTATDMVLTVTHRLRQLGVVGKFVEFYGPGLHDLSLADRATISNMAPEYGATMGFFPVDDMACKYLIDSGRTPDVVERVKKYLQSVQLYGAEGDQANITYTHNIELDLGDVVPCMAGPKRPHDRVPLAKMKTDFAECLNNAPGHKGFGVPAEKQSDKTSFTYEGKEYNLSHGSVVITAITSCTNTSNPSVMLAAGLVAKKAVEKGLKVPPYIKTSLSPGSGVVKEYLEASGLQSYLSQVGFDLVGFGCMTCIGNSGDLPAEVAEAISKENLVTAAVLSGNRNFEARVHPQVAGAYLASPPLVVAYALASRVDLDFDKEPIGTGSDGKPVFLKDIWPTHQEIQDIMTSSIKPEMFTDIYGNIKTSNPAWNNLEAPTGASYEWDEVSTYIHNPPFFQDFELEPKPVSKISDAATILMLGDSITTDHISPAGRIAEKSPAGAFLLSRGVSRLDFNTYGSRRGNDLIMTRGTFANVKLANKMVPGKNGPWTKYNPTGEEMFVFDAAQKYKESGTPLVVLAGKEYGSGSSRDWAAKGTSLLGIRIVIAQSYERIHRSNLVGMGVIPLQFKDGENAESLGLNGTEPITLDLGDLDALKPGQEVTVQAGSKSFQAVLRFDTPVEIQYYKHGGILNYVLRGKLKN